jgi:hypothetical protein
MFGLLVFRLFENGSSILWFPKWCEDGGLERSQTRNMDLLCC